MAEGGTTAAKGGVMAAEGGAVERRGGGGGMEAAAAVRPGSAGLLTGVEYSRVGSTAWVHPTSTVTTRIAVELVYVQGNYPTHSE